MKKYKYTTIFSSEIKPLVSEEKDKFLALASLEEVGSFIPDIDTDSNYDLLPVAFNAAVANRVNKNGDVIDTETAVAIYKNFINKPINIEHNREKVIGVILTAGFSEFGTDNPMTEEQAKASEEPFNITLGGVIWKVANSALANIIENSGDPTSEDYLRVSASWELGFSDFQIVALEGQEKNIKEGITISENNEIESIKDNLKAYGGTGKIDENTFIYRKVVNNVVPLGIGLTETPAADVEGVAVQKSEEDLILNKNKNNSSQKEEKTVKEDKEIRIMKINSMTDITDESLKVLEASAVSDFITDEIKKAADKYEQEKTKVDDALQAQTEEHKTLAEQHEATKSDLEKIKTELDSLQAEKQEREAQERFDTRMSLMDEEYELTDQDREVIASDIKDLEEEDFSAYQEKMKVLLSSKNKEVLKAEHQAEEEVKAKKAEEAKEAVAETKASETTEDVVEEAVNNAEEKEEAIANSTSVEDDTLHNKYKSAFNIENFDIKL
jgi:hypothetical protein